MTDEQVAIAKALGRASLPMASGANRFVRDMAAWAEHHPKREITDKQDIYLRELAYRFRRQMPPGLLKIFETSSGKLTTLQWLGPEMARNGLLKNEGWVTASAEEADALFPNQAMKTAAVMMAVLHQGAIDYINQAPVIVLAMMQGGDFHKPKNRQFVAEKLRPLLERGPKLRELMGMFDLPLPLRALSAWAFGPGKWPAVKMLTKVPPSTLAQSIPAKPGRQAKWLDELLAWTDTMNRRFASPYLLATWAASHFQGTGHAHTATGAANLADFAGSPGTNFNERWTLAKASEEALRWHTELAAKSSEEQFFARNGFGWKDPINYGPLPTEMEVEGLRIVALRSGEESWLEGRAMHHCVSSYTQAVVGGKCRLFSVRRGDERLATVELAKVNAVLTKQPMSYLGKWMIAQIKGPCNEVPVMSAHAAAARFIEKINGELTGLL